MHGFLACVHTLRHASLNAHYWQGFDDMGTLGEPVVFRALPHALVRFFVSSSLQLVATFEVSCSCTTL